MKRRDFILAFGSAAAGWPLAAHAQQPAMPVVGFALSSSAGVLRRALSGFEDGLKNTGYIAGKNVAIEYRFADGQFERFPVFISEFVKREVAVIVTSSFGFPSAKKETSTIPIIFTMGDDPVETGIVPSLNRPGGNVTGVYQFTTGLEGKRLGLLHEMIPKASTLAVLIHPNNPASDRNDVMCRKQQTVWACSSWSCAPMQKANLMPDSRVPLNKKLGRCWSLRRRSTTPSANTLSC